MKSMSSAGPCLYVVFSSTPTGMGRLIRMVTNRTFNHVSLSLGPNLTPMWSFARYHRDAPLWGGLVQESPLRCRGARLKVCRIPVSEERYDALSRRLNAMWEERETWLYNTLAAVASLSGLTPSIPHCHTCVSFVQEMLLSSGAVKRDLLPRCPKVGGLEDALAPFVWREFTLSPAGDWGEDRYLRPLRWDEGVRGTAGHFGRLAGRVLLGGA